MISNDYLRSIRYILNISDTGMCKIAALNGHEVPLDKMEAYLKSEEEPGFIRCPDLTMANFLDGLVIQKRGKDETRAPIPFEIPVTNNTVLKKLKVAFSLKEEDMHAVLALDGFKIGRAELSAFLRKKGQDNYRECGDQFMRHFFKGLAQKVQSGK